jgi:hypothetical protein
MKTAIIIIADPKSATEEATARVFNALALAEEGKRQGDQVEVTFIGTGARWPAELAQLGHPQTRSTRMLGVSLKVSPAAVLPSLTQQKLSKPAACRSSKKIPSMARPVSQRPTLFRRGMGYNRVLKIEPRTRL